MKNTIPANFRNLFAIGILIYVICKNIGNLISILLQDILSMFNTSFWVSFFLCEFLPVLITLLIAYFVSAKIWNTISVKGERINAVVIRFSIILLAIWIFGFVYPFYLRAVLFRDLSPYYSRARTNEMAYFTILRTTFSYLEMIGLILIIGIRKERISLSLDENLEQM